MATPPSHVAIIGAGTMGSGLAVQFARHGTSTTLIDHRQSNLDTARESVTDALTFLQKEDLLTGDQAAIRELIDYTLETATGVADADLVLETVSESREVKRAVRDGYALRTAAVGPFETADLSGVDLFRDIANNLYPELSTATEAGPVFEDRIATGDTGVTSGAGFHTYEESLAEAIQRRDERIAAIQRARNETRGRED